MSTTSGTRFTCDGCNRSYAWKAELAGKRVKCKCGHVMTVPQSIAPAESDDDALYALADAEDQAARKQTVQVVAAPAPAPASPKGKAKPAAAVAAGNRGVPLAYKSAPTARERQRASSAVHTDPMRDIYVPAGLFVVGLLIYVLYYAIKYELGGTGIAMTTLGLGLITAFKAALLIGFALVVAGPVGVSFGHPATAALKLAALAVFTDGVVTWVDAGVAKMSGGTGAFEGMISFPVALAIYWGLLIYLFSMDPGDSWFVVILLAVFDFIVRWVLLLLLLKIILSWGGVSGAAIPSMGGSAPAGASALTTHVNEMKETNALEEARALIKDGHQAILGPTVENWYAAGCPNVWFVVSRDFNGKRTPEGVIVELPKDKDNRAKCYGIMKAYYDQVQIPYDPQDLKDTGERYLEVQLR